jgi:hypothetical protein
MYIVAFNKLNAVKWGKIILVNNKEIVKNYFKN